jgi:hypothetical protein
MEWQLRWGDEGGVVLVNEWIDNRYDLLEKNFQVEIDIVYICHNGNRFKTFNNWIVSLLSKGASIDLVFTLSFRSRVKSRCPFECYIL